MTGRSTLFSVLNGTLPGSTNLGEYQTGAYSRLVGIFSTVGSLTLRYQMNTHSGATAVTSSVVINSGGSILDVLSFGRTTQFTVTAANSQVWNAAIMGQLAR